MLGPKPCSQIVRYIWRRSTSYSRSSSEAIVKSPFELPDLNSAPFNVPFQRFLMHEFLAADRSEEVAIVDGFTGDQLTYRELHDTTYSFANNLRKSFGVGKADCVAIFSPNDLYYFTVFHGVGLTEGFATTINPLYTVEEPFYQVNATKAKLIIAHPVCLAKAYIVAARLGIPVISLGDLNPTATTGSEHRSGQIVSVSDMICDKIDSIDLDSFIGGTAGSNSKNSRNQFDPNTAIAAVPFSSGTTGLPKGVVLTHRNLIANALQGCAYEGDYLRPTETSPRGTCICPLPLFHFYGLTAALNMTTYAGGKLVLMPSFDLQKFLELIQKYRVTRGLVVPPMVFALAKHPIVDKYDLSSVNTLLCGAAPLGAELQKRCLERLKFPVKQGYGMSEATSFITITPDSMLESSLDDDVSGSVGILMPGTEGKIVDPTTGTELPPTATGELLIRGPQVMNGYLNNPEATRKTVDSEGWLHTGDIGHFNSRGCLFITDRCKELIKYKGFQVSPSELEAVIVSMEGVRDVIVIPVPDEIAGEIPRAYVVRQRQMEPSVRETGGSYLGEPLSPPLTEQDVIDFVVQRVAPHKRLRGGVRFTNTIPKSPSGKLLRKVQIQLDRETSTSNSTST